MSWIEGGLYNIFKFTGPFQTLIVREERNLNIVAWSAMKTLLQDGAPKSLLHPIQITKESYSYALDLRYTIVH